MATREVGEKPSERVSNWPQKMCFKAGVINFVKHGREVKIT